MVIAEKSLIRNPTRLIQGDIPYFGIFDVDGSVVLEVHQRLQSHPELGLAGFPIATKIAYWVWMMEQCGHRQQLLMGGLGRSDCQHPANIGIAYGIQIQAGMVSGPGNLLLATDCVLVCESHLAETTTRISEDLVIQNAERYNSASLAVVIRPVNLPPGPKEVVIDCAAHII